MQEEEGVPANNASDSPHGRFLGLVAVIGGHVIRADEHHCRFWVLGNRDVPVEKPPPEMPNLIP